MAALHVVATPIGNLDDVTLRALRVLREAALVLAEDTRHTRRLLERHDIVRKLVSLHEHNEASRIEQVLASLAAGEDVALVSDAGTPLVSDPGSRLVAAALEAGYPVLPVPGPSAVLAALVAAGLGTERFTFLGFLPRKAGPRRELLARFFSAQETLVLFESPRRVAATLRELADVLGDRRACVARELTKLHEESARGSLQELAEHFAEGTRGEVTLVVEGAGPEPPLTLEELETEIRRRLANGDSPRTISTALATRGLSRREIYARALALKDT